MPRGKFWGLLCVGVSALCAWLFISNAGLYAFSRSAQHFPIDLHNLNSSTYYSLVIPIMFPTVLFLLNGIYICWTILTIKVEPPMPELVEKNDYARIKAALLCTAIVSILILLGYGVYIRSYWALAIPAAAVTCVVLGAMFWVGFAILTSRNTLPSLKKNS